MSYCDFNPKLFREFTSKHIKVKPALSDDWEMIPSKFRSLDGFSLKSKKINQEVADIDLYRFLSFCKEFNITIESLMLKGNFIVGNDRSVYSEDMYNEWKGIYDKRTEVILEEKDWIPGHLYLTPCGMEVIYLGFRYVSNIKPVAFRHKDFTDISKVTKKHFCLPSGNSNEYIEVMKYKFTKDKGVKITPEDCDVIFTIHYNKNLSYTYFSNKKPTKDIKYGLIKLEPYIYEYKNTKHFEALIVSVENRYYSGYFSYRNVEVRDEKTVGELARFDTNTLKRIDGERMIYGNDIGTKFNEYYRIGVIE